MIDSPRDSLIDALSIGKIDLVGAAIAESETILSIPGGQKRSTVRDVVDESSAKTLLALTDSLLKKLGSGTLGSVVGERISVGVSLFPGAEFNEFLLEVSSPWKCAVIAANAETGRSIGCYALTGGIHAVMAEYFFARSLQSDTVRLGFHVLPIGPATTSTASLHLRQWLFSIRDKQAVVSIYSEPYTPNQFSDQRTGMIVLWFSFSDLNTIPKRPERIVVPNKQ